MLLPYPSLRQGLVGAWCPSISNSAAVLNDLSRNSQNGYVMAGTGVTSIVPLADSVGSTLPCLYFPGTTTAGPAYLATGPVRASEIRSMSVWICPTGYPQIASYPVYIGGGTASSQVILRLVSGSVKAEIPSAGNLSWRITTTLPSNKLTHLVIVKNDTQIVGMWMNGFAAGFAAAFDSGATSSGFYIGSRAVQYSFTGYLDDLRLYNRALTPAEIRLLASRRGIGLSPSAPLHDDDAESVQYPITDPPNRVHANVDGVWVPGQVRANASGTWGNGETLVNQGGVWPARQYHQESLFWKSRVEAGGGTVSDTTLDAVSAFCSAIDAAGIRGRFARLNLFCGTGLSACLTPLYLSLSYQGGELGNATDRNFNFVAGDYVETGASAGLTGNGTSKYLNTGFPANAIATNIMHLGVGLVTANTLSGNRSAIGAFSGSDIVGIPCTSTGRLSGIFGSFGLTSHQCGASTSGVQLQPGNLVAAYPTFYRNGTIEAPSASAFRQYTLGTPIGVFCLPDGSSVPGGVPGGFVDARLGWYSIGLTMTAAQVAAYNAALASFRTAMGRS